MSDLSLLEKIEEKEALGMITNKRIDFIVEDDIITSLNQTQKTNYQRAYAN